MVNIAFHAGSKADAKKELATRNAKNEKPMPPGLLDAVSSLVDALPDVTGKPTVAVGLSGTAEALTVTIHRLPTDA